MSVVLDYVLEQHLNFPSLLLGARVDPMQLELLELDARFQILVELVVGFRP